MKKKVAYALVAIVAVILVSVAINSYGPKGSQSITNKPLGGAYVWKSGSMLVKGKVVPETCALETKNCACNLSDADDSCTFNLNLNGLNHAAKIQTKPNPLKMASISYTNSSGCMNSESNDIVNCSITFKWDKTAAGSEQAQIQLVGAEGVQSLINLQLHAVK